MTFHASKAIVRAFACLLVTGLAACTANGATEEQATAEVTASAITNTESGGITTTTVNASSRDKWIYMDLTWKTEVFPSSPGSSPNWDLSFNRFNIKANSGSSGPGTAGVATLTGANFDQVRIAPATGYASDTADAAALGGWYEYDHATHLLKPANVVFVIRSVAEDYYKVQFTGYYTASNEAGYPTFRWAPIDPPASVE